MVRAASVDPVGMHDARSRLARGLVRRVAWLQRAVATWLAVRLARSLNATVLFSDGRSAPEPAEYDLVPKGRYDYVPKGSYVSGPAERFLLVPKNRYRLTLLEGQAATADLGVGWVTEQNTPEGYDRLWGDTLAVEGYKSEGNGVRERMPHEIVAALPDAVRRARSVCDIGCGVGDLLAAVQQLNSYVQLAGLDFSEAAVARASARFPGGTFVRHIIVDSLPLPSDAFDVVFCTDVLEHIEHRGSLVSELMRICAPGGDVLIVVPDGDVDQFFGHLWFFDQSSLAAFLEPWSAEVRRLQDCREFLAHMQKPASAPGPERRVS